MDAKEMIPNHIPEEWISNYVKTLLDMAGKLSPGTFQDAVTLRAEHALDLVDAWHNREKNDAE
jgi:hypothetical protein